MARLIDADKYPCQTCNVSYCHQNCEKFIAWFNETVDAVEVVHGRWVDHMVRDWRCSECGEPIYKVRHVDGYCYDDKPNYCPNCGAKMEGKRKDNE